MVLDHIWVSGSWADADFMIQGGVDAVYLIHEIT